MLSMATITVNVDDDVFVKFRARALAESGGKKGFLGDAITDAMRKVVTSKEADEASQRLLALSKKGFNLGVWRKGFDRDALYDHH